MVKKTGNIRTAVFVIGEAMSCPFPMGDEAAHFLKLDSEIPLISLLRDSAALEDPNIWNLDFWLDKHAVSHTFAELEAIVLGNTTYAKVYRDIEKNVLKWAPNEWNTDMDAYVDRTGAGQLLQNGVLKILAAMALGMDEALVGYLLDLDVSMITMFCGLTGGTGAAALLALKPILQKAGFTSIVPMGALTHVPSIQVNGKVSRHVVTRVEQMLHLIPNLVIFTGMASIRPDGNTWNDIVEMTPRLAELFSNVTKLAATHETAPNMWLLGINRRESLIDRWMVHLLTSVGQMDPEDAIVVLQRYIAAGYINFGPADSKGFCPAVLKNRELLHLEHLQELLPALLYVKHTPVKIKGTHKVPGLIPFTHRDEEYSVMLKGSTMIDELLRKAGVSSVGDLKKNGYSGLAQYETWLINGSLGYTQEDAVAYWKVSWVELARIYSGAALGKDVCFEAGEFVPVKDGSFYTWTQPKLSQHSLVISALEVLGEVDDPEVAIAAQAAARARTKKIKERLQKD